ncbi:MAG: S41 family peptidase [bacterium]|nr:S41 family peptidase [bacterium]
MASKKKTNPNPTLKIIAGIGSALIIASLIFLGFFVGYKEGVRENKVFTIENVKNLGDKEKEADFAIFWEAWTTLKGVHIDGPEIVSQDLVYGAIKGLAGAFNDPYTVYFPPAEARKFEEDVSGRFYGIGAEIDLNESGNVIVITPLKDSPAEKSGLRAADLILEIDGISTKGMTTDEAVTLIRGELGDPVILTVARENELLEIVITREEIQVPTLSYELVGDREQFAHIYLSSFNENAASAFAKALRDAESDNAKGIIVDLRFNPGGFLEVANNLAGWFIDRGEVVVTERFRVGNDHEFRSRGTGEFKDFPVVILVNEGSASASEIFAGALRDHNDVPLIGKTTFGKGTVQELVRLSDNSSLKITIAEWEMPAGQILTRDGLTPDFEVDLDIDRLEAEGIDSQLEEAIDILGQLSNGLSLAEIK